MKYGLGYTLVMKLTGTLSNSLVRNTEFKYMSDLVKREKGKRILDYGCDSGYLTNMINNAAPKNEVCGADINIYAIIIARKKYKHIKFYEITDEFFKKNKFDIIIVSHVLEHLIERKEFMRKLLKILSDDCKIIIAIPQERIRGDASIPTFLLNLIKLRFENPHIVKLDYNDLQNLFDKIGFKINEKTYTNYFPPFKSEKRKFYSWSLVVSASKA